MVASGTSLFNPEWEGVDEVTVSISPTPYYVLIEYEDGGIFDQTVFPAVNVTTPGEIIRLSY